MFLLAITKNFLDGVGDLHLLVPKHQLLYATELLQSVA